MTKHPVKMDRVSSMSDVELLPGFDVLDHSYRRTRLLIPSGYDITVHRAGPYLWEVLDFDPDMKPLGPYVIKIRMMEKLQPPGIEVEHVYEPPVDEDGKVYCPDQEEHPKAYAYYMGWREHERKRVERLAEIAKRRKNLALVNCVRINNGPWCVDDEEWLEPLTGMVPYPETSGARRLLFLQTQVVTTETIRDVLMFLWHVEEVTIEGLKSAFDSFRSRVSWATSVRNVR